LSIQNDDLSFADKTSHLINL